jgi:hypothetical protein
MITNGRDTALLRTAERVGRAFGTWRRRRAAAKQDAFVEAWKTAWADGCHSRWQGGLRDEVPYDHEDQRTAWLAGWQWADTHPDRRHRESAPTRGYRRSTDFRTRLARGARRGAAGLTLMAFARWWWRRRGDAQPGTIPDHLDAPDLER